MTQQQTRAQLIDERQETHDLWERFREWIKESLFIVPLSFLVGAVVLALVMNKVDMHLQSFADLRGFWRGHTDQAITVTTVIASSMLSFLAVVFSVSLVALQLASQQYSPRVVHTYQRAPLTKVALSFFIATFVYSLVLLAKVLRTDLEWIPIASLLVAILLVFASLICFVAFLRAILLMMRATHTISNIADETRQTVEELFPPEDSYVLCQTEPLGELKQMIKYEYPPRRLFSSRHAQGVLESVGTVSLVEIARRYGCVLRVLRRHGDYINEGDPLVEVYGAGGVDTEEVLACFQIEPGRSIAEDPAHGLRILVDIALQALSPGVNAPTTATQVIYRLTDLLAAIARKPAPTGLFTDHEGQIRLVRPVRSWDDYVDLAFTEILFYGGGQPQPNQKLAWALDYLLERVPEGHRAPLERQKGLLLQTIDNSQTTA